MDRHVAYGVRALHKGASRRHNQLLLGGRSCTAEKNEERTVVGSRQLQLELELLEQQRIVVDLVIA